MRQVPKKLNYLIVGRGRLARHLGFYFTTKGISHTFWDRSQSQSELKKSINGCDAILLAISDSSLSEFLQMHADLLQTPKWVVHFSGAMVLEGAWGAHPLMSFGEGLYPESVYETIPFVVEEDASQFHKIFPELSNPVFAISPERRALYHALCVVSGNFTTLVWETIFERAESQLDLPRSIFFPYMKQVVANVQEFGGKALTGPLVRGDRSTVASNLNALKGDRLADLYSLMMTFFEERNSSQKRASALKIRGNL